MITDSVSASDSVSDADSASDAVAGSSASSVAVRALFGMLDALRLLGVWVGLFVLANVVGEWIRGPFDTLSEWCTLPGRPWIHTLIEAAVGLSLLVTGLLVSPHRWLRRAVAALFVGVSVFAGIDAVRFYLALSSHSIKTPVFLPASLLVVLFFAALAGRLLFAPPARDLVRPRLRSYVLAAVALFFLLPMVRVVTFGVTRYERPADCAVVFGARVWNSGEPSFALADRVDESVSLFQRGLVSHIVMSGAWEPDSGYSETEVMASRAEAGGVPREAILVDDAGKDTTSTVKNTTALMKAHHFQSLLVVTHYYHEPRSKMLFDRAFVKDSGTRLQAFTVPATMHRRLAKEPWFLFRETIAFWHSFLLE